jgi:hypothetical protein
VTSFFFKQLSQKNEPKTYLTLSFYNRDKKNIFRIYNLIYENSLIFLHMKNIIYILFLTFYEILYTKIAFNSNFRWHCQLYIWVGGGWCQQGTCHTKQLDPL